MVANLSRGRYNADSIHTLIKAQIENSLNVGWDVNDIILLANFDFEFMGVKSIQSALNKHCLTGSKMYGMKYLFDNDMVNDVIWAHDLDAWQSIPFYCPEFKDVGITCYSTSKYNGGSIFWKNSSKDIVHKIIKKIEANSQNKEEPTLNKILKSEKYKNRVTNINNTFNVGCSGYAKRWNRSVKPIRVCHFHPYNKTAWETHVLDRNGLDTKGVSDRLESLLRKYYPKLATKLGKKGQVAHDERKAQRLASVSASQALIS